MTDRDQLVAEYPLVVNISTLLFQPFMLWVFIFLGAWKIWWMWPIFAGSLWSSGFLPLTSPRRFTISGGRLDVLWFFGREESFALADTTFTVRQGALSLLAGFETLEASNGRRLLVWTFLRNKSELWSALGLGDRA